MYNHNSCDLRSSGLLLESETASPVLSMAP